MNRFKVENETILDTKTNLMWMQNQLEGVFTFDEAIKIEKEFAGFDVLYYFVPAIIVLLLTITASFCVVYYLKLYLESK